VTPAKQALERLAQAIDAACAIENDWWDAEYADVHAALPLVAAELDRAERLEAEVERLNSELTEWRTSMATEALKWRADASSQP
jgi:hypothetical protein